MTNKRSMRAALAPYAYIAPIAAILLVFVVGSVLLSVGLSFTKYNIITPPSFVGTGNYERLAGDAKFAKAFANTLLLIVMIVPAQMAVSLAVAAFLVAKRRTLLGRLANAAVFVPVLCSNAAVGVVWRNMLAANIPAVTWVFGLVGLNPAMLIGDSSTALATVAFVAVWKWVGYYVVIFSSGLLSISGSYHEAAQVDGAGPLRRFFHITLPLMKPTIILALFLSVTNALQYYDLIFNLTGGGPNNASTTLVYYAYSLCFGSGSAGYAMAVSDVLFLVVLGFALLQSGLLRRDASTV